LVGREKHFAYAKVLSKCFPGGTNSRKLDASVKPGALSELYGTGISVQP